MKIELGTKVKVKGNDYIVFFPYYGEGFWNQNFPTDEQMENPTAYTAHPFVTVGGVDFHFTVGRELEIIKTKDITLTP